MEYPMVENEQQAPPVFSMDKALEIVDGEKELLTEMIHLFCEFGPQTAARIKAAVAGENLEEARHTNELVDPGTVTINIDHMQMGVGGDDSWGAPVHDEYRLAPKKYSYSFTLAPGFWSQFKDQDQ